MKKQLRSLLLISMMTLAVTAFPPTLTLAASGSSTITDQIDDIRTETTLPDNTPMGVFLFTMKWLLNIFTIIAVLGFIVAGITYILAGSSKDLADQAKNGVKYAIMGIVVALSAYIIINLIAYLLEGTVSTV